MKQVRYQLRSDPLMSIVIPEDYAINAENTLKLARDNIEALLAEPTPFLEDSAILGNINALASTMLGSKESYKLEDQLYLQICLYQNQHSEEMFGKAHPYKSSFKEFLTARLKRL